MKRALVLVDVDNVGARPRRLPALRPSLASAAAGGERFVEVVFGATLAKASSELGWAKLSELAEALVGSLRADLAAPGGPTSWSLVLAHQAPESTDAALLTALRSATSPRTAGDYDLVVLVSEDCFVEAGSLPTGWRRIRHGSPFAWAPGPGARTLHRAFGRGLPGFETGSSSPIAVCASAATGAPPPIELAPARTVPELARFVTDRPWTLSQISATNERAHGAGRLRAWLDDGGAVLDLAEGERCELARGDAAASRSVRASRVELSSAGTGAVRVWYEADGRPELRVLRSRLPVAALEAAARRGELPLASPSELDDAACLRRVPEGEALAAADVRFDWGQALVRGAPPAAWWFYQRKASAKEWYPGGFAGVVRAELARRRDELVLRIPRARPFEVEVAALTLAGEVGPARCVQTGELIALVPVERSLAQGHRLRVHRVERDARVPPNVRRLPLAAPLSANYVPDVVTP